jgi:hypothetical protein
MPLPLPDFNLAPLQAIQPNTLLQSKADKVGTLMLALAAAYNDLKGADYCVYQLARMRAQAQADTLERRGQFAGMGQQVLRTIIGIMHEILVELNESRNEVATGEFQGYVTHLNAEYKADWQRVWDVATSADRVANRRDALSQILLKARNLSFHYSRNALAAGYAEHFAASAAATLSDRALVSIGASMEETLFYYADAAAVAGLTVVTGVSGEDLISANLRGGSASESGALRAFGSVHRRAFTYSYIVPSSADAATFAPAAEAVQEEAEGPSQAPLN